MALTKNRPFNVIRVYAHLADLSTASSAFVTAPCRGTIVKMGSIIFNAVTTANAAVTTEINGTAVTGGDWTVTQSGSAAGDVDTAEPTGANLVVEDDKIEFITDGSCDTTCPTTFFADIRVD